MAQDRPQSVSASMEDYLEAIYRIVQERQAALPRDISSRLNVGASSVSSALKTLVSQHLANHEAYGIVTLTEAGEEVAREVVRKHDALRDFLVMILCVDEEEADEAACRMEHAVGENIVNRFVAFMDYVRNCPHWDVEWADDARYRCGDSKPACPCRSAEPPSPPAGGEGGPCPVNSNSTMVEGTLCE